MWLTANESRRRCVTIGSEDTQYCLEWPHSEPWPLPSVDVGRQGKKELLACKSWWRTSRMQRFGPNSCRQNVVLQTRTQQQRHDLIF